MIKVVFVCLGNICRSPTAEGVFRELLRRYKLEEKISCESRGTGPWHVGEPPDPRSQACALKNGIDISDLRGRQFSTYDFVNFDYIVVMDHSNFADVIRLAANSSDKQKIELLMNYSSGGRDMAVPDPYRGGTEGFQNVFDMIKEACEGLIIEIQKKHLM